MLLKKAKDVFNEYPRKFWVLIFASFIDRLGGALIFPFFALYITKKFEVGMVEAGKFLAIFAISGMVGSMLGGALADKFGRRSILVFGLLFSAASSVLMGMVNQVNTFYLLVVAVGILGNIGGPARKAMIADLVPQSQRSEAYGVYRVVVNLSATIGPAIGGLLAGVSYMLLFILDGIASTIVAVIVLLKLPETKPETIMEQDKQSLLSSFAGYYQVTKDTAFMAFVFTSMFMVVVYTQMNGTLSVFLRDVHGIPEQGYGALVSLNAGIVVLFQVWLTRRISNKPPMLMMALGTFFFVIGFSMYGFVSQYFLFMLAMLIITIGEMIVTPVHQTIAANMAPEDMRGRYMAVSSFSWIVPNTIGPLAAGFVMDNYNPNWVWYISGILASITVVTFLYLGSRVEGLNMIKRDLQSQKSRKSL